MLKKDELSKLSADELKKELEKASKELFKTRFEVSTGSSKSNHEIGKLKKYRARMKTLERQMAAEEKAKFKKQKEVEEPTN